MHPPSLILPFCLPPSFPTPWPTSLIFTSTRFYSHTRSSPRLHTVLQLQEVSTTLKAQHNCAPVFIAPELREKYYKGVCSAQFHNLNV